MSDQEKKSSRDLSLSEDEIILSGLMRKALDGDSESYGQLLQRVKQLMTPFISNTLSKFGLMASGGHEDVLQEVLLGLHLKRSTYDPSQFFLPWMYAIGRYKTIDHLRRNKILFKSVSLEGEASALEEISMGDFDPDPGSGLTAARDLEALCAQLSTKQRDLLLLVKVEGLSILEVAQRTGFSVSDVKVTVHRALKELKKKQIGNQNHEK
jgi:RNA polymerase sigma-70 factor (ECF subfamily)